MTDQPIVNTTTGMVRGRAEDGLLAFRGIPYAAPPVGPARWQAARSHPGWTGVRDATRYGPSAPQPWMPGGSPVIGTHGDPPFAEDCLTLNLWTPGLDDARRPVLVWIHGGGFLTGSGNMPAYATDTFARDGDLVGISINYRLGPLGFLAGAGDENVWLTDQVAALQWIAGNVEAFGGDQARITLAGQSGGAFSIAALAQHPGVRDLFHGGILQSPPLGLELPSAEDAVTRTRALARHLGHSSIGALRGEPWENLIGGTIGVLGEYAEFGEWSLAYCPVIDDATMPRHPIAALTDTSLEVIIGWTRDEASFTFALDPQYAGTTSEQVTAWAAKRHPGRAEDLYHAYAAAHPGRGPAGVLSQIVTDELFRCGGLRVAGERARTRPVRVYQFEVTSPLAAGALGATHCLDLPFSFASMDRWASAPFIQGLRDDVTGRVTGALHNAWIAFARDGGPSHPASQPGTHTTPKAARCSSSPTTTSVSCPACQCLPPAPTNKARRRRAARRRRPACLLPRHVRAHRSGADLLDGNSPGRLPKATGVPVEVAAQPLRRPQSSGKDQARRRRHAAKSAPVASVKPSARSVINTTALVVP